MPRFFTLSQAEQLLPEVESLIREALESKSRFEEIESELQSYSRRIAMMGGTNVNRDHLMGVKARRDDTVTRLKQAIETVHSHGCLIKDLDIGLLDFPTLYRGQEVYLCWKLGETGIEFWHGVSEGFAGRKKIDREFLDSHKGDLTN